MYRSNMTDMSSRLDRWDKRMTGRPLMAAAVGASLSGVTAKDPAWVGTSRIYGLAPRRTVCCRCDEPLQPGEQAASMPGFTNRGWAHATCHPPNPSPKSSVR